VVKVSSPDLLFIDGFESGDTGVVGDGAVG
jgi:hypothetical protein